jgi:hypothetical protein
MYLRVANAPGAGEIVTAEGTLDPAIWRATLLEYPTRVVFDDGSGR